MRATFAGLLITGITGMMFLARSDAADTSVIVLEPVHHSFVEGDHQKYSSQHWVKEDYFGGIREFSMSRTLDTGVSVVTEGHALIDQNDLESSLLISKEGLGFLKVHFSEFRKYYDGTGGTFYRFTGSLGTPETFRELQMDMGKLEIEAGLRKGNWPELDFLYERDYKDGVKSRLSWTAVKTSTFGLGVVTRNTGPSWQEVDEVVDTFAIKAKQELAGFTLKGEQRWEFTRIESFREERNLATTGVAADTKIRRQNQEPEADLMTTLLGGERWFLNDKLFVASGYRFGHMDNREWETLTEYSAAGVPTNYSNPKNKPNARADNDYDTHTWVQNFLFKPKEWLSIGTKIKAEVIKRESNSTYPSDTTSPTPDGIINTTEKSLNDNKATRFGESLSLRFTKIPKTALYTELELEQSRVLVREDRTSQAGQSGSDANEIFSRETVTDIDRGNATLGWRFLPVSWLDLTTHLRHRWNKTDYDDQRETSPGSSTAKSAFFDGQSTKTHEIATKMTFKPCRWFQPSLRYQFRDDDYATRVENEPIVKTGMISHIYTADLTLQPRQDLSTTLSFSRQNALTFTPARLASSANIPSFHADVASWLLATEYLPKPDITFTNTLYYSIAENFDDFSLNGMPYGVDDERFDVETGITWLLKESATLKTEYAFSQYQPHSQAGSGAYKAHVIWLELSRKF